jgi:hypothetical protein
MMMVGAVITPTRESTVWPHAVTGKTSIGSAFPKLHTRIEIMLTVNAEHIMTLSSRR